MERKPICGDIHGVGMKIEIQSLFRISCRTDLTVQKIKRTPSGDFLRFRKDFDDWEVTELQRLLAILHRQAISIDNSDALWWGLGNSGIFSIKSFKRSFWLGSV